MGGMRSFNGRKMHINRLWNRLALGCTKKALTNTVTYPTFSVKEAIETLSSGRKLHSCQPSRSSPPDTVQYWDGSVPSVAADRDGIPMVVHLPGLNQSHTELTTTAMELMGSNHFVREQQGTMECGVIDEQGHPNHTPHPALSITGKTINHFDEMSAVNEAFESPREAMNGVLSIIDEDWYAVLQAIREKLKSGRSRSVEAHQSLDPSLLPSHTLSWNNLHPDHSNCARGWSGFHATGNYEEGGELWIPALKLRLRFLPGDFILIRGALLDHVILPFKGGVRFADTSYLPAAFLSQDEEMNERAQRAPLSTVHDIINRLSEAQAERDSACNEKLKKPKSQKKKTHEKKSPVGRIPMHELKLKRLADTFDRHHKKD